MYKIISDGSCDFTNAEVAAFDIKVIPFYVTFDGKSLKEGVEIQKDEYFNRLLTDKEFKPTTAQASPQDFIDVYTPYLEQGQDIMVFTVSSKLSGSYNSATLAANMMAEEYPNSRIEIVDTQNASLGHGLILRESIKMRDAGFDLDKNLRITREIVKTARLYITLDSLDFLRRGGRVGPTTALVGGILGLRPILQIEEGAVTQLDSVRGKAKVLKLMEDGIVEALGDNKAQVSICVGHILKEDEAEKFHKSLEASLDMKIANPITSVGVTVGTHAGPGAMAIAYCKRYESFAAAQTTGSAKAEKIAAI